ncbi:MarR family winged helix-turn-helix transcriptional regulator [Paenibacillus sp. TAB 01]|uniref:MarR family winged helix-turn-helix transcriptional regulator n=1 Tax=Paenibacillus sp. TAB 01 TaxID=3368988 RepID=UPI00375301F4
MSREQEAASLWRSLLDLNRQLKLTFQVMNADNQYSNSSIAIIFQLEHKTMKMNDIADYLGITLGAATSLVDKLERQNIVERVRSEEDRRIIYVGLTPHGKETLVAIREHFASEARIIFEDVSDEQLEAWNQQLKQVAHVVTVYNQRNEPTK